jgi:hypothetical protein
MLNYVPRREDIFLKLSIRRGDFCLPDLIQLHVQNVLGDFTVDVDQSKNKTDPPL